MSAQVHIVNVGKGVTAILTPPSGNLSVIDVDDSRTASREERLSRVSLELPSLTNPIDYLDDYFPGADIFRFILTHPDMDHMSGIYRLFNERRVYNFWDIEKEKEDPGNWDSSPYNEDDWRFYQDLRKGKYSGSTKNIINVRGRKGDFWTQDGIEIFHPHPDIEELVEGPDDFDHLSHVLRFTHGGSVLFGGDATIEAWEHLLEDGVDINADILVAPGHGSKNHMTGEILKQISPKLTIVSVAEGVDYDYDKYSLYGEVLSTKFFGNIKVSVEADGSITYSTEAGKYSGSWYRLI